MANDTEVIRQQMAETRSALSEKLEAVEDLVTSTVKETTQTVSDTVATVAGTVESTVSTVADSVESVKQALDITTYVEKYPWLMVGGCVALGYALGRSLPGLNGSAAGTAAYASETERESALPPPSAGEAPTSAQRQPASQESFFQSSWAPLLDKLKGLALGTAAGVIGEMVMNAVPENLKSQVSEMVDEATRALGGTIVR
jgi:ElaB/YqjD/DUF883 family membrane-anchored ribosome-binding protein